MTRRNPLAPLLAIPLLGALLLVLAPTPPPRPPLRLALALPLGGVYDRRIDELVGADGLDEASVYALLLGGRG